MAPKSLCKFQRLAKLIALAFLANVSPVFAVENPDKVPSEILALPSGPVLKPDDAVARAYRQNSEIETKRLEVERLQIIADQAFHNAYLPTISVELNSTSNTTLFGVPGQNKRLIGSSQDNHGYPYTEFSMGLGRYTLFNFGRDALLLKQAELDLSRAKDNLAEAKRSVRNRTIFALYRLRIVAEKFDAAKQSFFITSSISRLVRARVRLGKSLDGDLSSAVIDQLEARNQLDHVRADYDQNLWDLNALLGDAIGMVYTIQFPLKYSTLGLSEEEAIKNFHEHSPSVRDAALAEKHAEIALDIAQRNRIPLPTVSLSGAFMYLGDSQQSATSAAHTGVPGNGNFELRSTITLSLPLWGPDGFFGSRVAQGARIQLLQSRSNGRTSMLLNETSLRQLISRTRQQEKLIANYEEGEKESLAVLESTFARFNKGQAGVGPLELRNAVRTARDSELSLKEALLEHLLDKHQISEATGIDIQAGEKL